MPSRDFKKGVPMKKMMMFSVMAIAIAYGLSAADKKSTAITTKKDIAYAEHTDINQRFNSLDIYAPSTGKDHPVMIFIHGGAWKIGDKRGVDLKPAAFVDAGYVFVSVNYRLHPQATWREQAGDVAAAIGWVKEHIKTYGGSADKISIMGHSAGAHLAALVATDETYLKAEKLKLNDLQSVVLLDGAGYDLPLHLKHIELRWLKGIFEDVFSTNIKQQEDASPIHHVAKNKDIPPFLILHVADRDNSKEQSEALGKKLVDAGGQAKVIACKNKSHRTINRELGKKEDQPTTDIFKFLNELKD